MRLPLCCSSSPSWRFAHFYRSATLLALALTGACTGSVTDLAAGAKPGTGAASAGGKGMVGTGIGTGGTGADQGSGGGSRTPPLANSPEALAAACAQSGGVLNAGLTPVRRLTRDQFNNTVRDLLGSSGTPADMLSDDEKIGPFYSNAIAPITNLVVQQHKEAAVALAAAARTRMAQISPCDLAAETGTSTTCATQFVTQFGRRVYRRPLTTAEVQQYVSLYTLGKQGDGAANGFRLVVETMLQSPFFLYHHDVGATGIPQATPVAVTPFELASRMSYFLWNSMPDEPLFTAATNGALATDTGLSTQVDRMLADSKAGATIAQFHRQWLDVGDLSQQLKDATMFPRYDAALTDAMAQELTLFTDYVVRKGDGLLKTLLTSNMAFPQGGLFDVYGVPQPAGYAVGTPVMLDATKRAGILTQAAFLARWSHNNQTSPVHRGKLVRLNLMCGYIPPPPNNVNTTPPPPSPATSTRDRFAQHSADPNCAGCHLLMDPIGLGFENYDSIGAYRTKDGLGDVNANGQINAAAADLSGTFHGAVELANKLANSSQVRDCVADQWFRFSMGRMETTNDACSLKAIHETFQTSGGNIRQLLSRIVLSPAFRNVRVSGG
ncbi:MAG: DUF1592 domain-containing protein [Polyangia bacterium]